MGKSGKMKTAKRLWRRAPWFLFAFFCFLWGFSLTGRAAPLQDVPTELTQPDGTEISCYSSGDEHFNYLHDEGGRLIVQDDDGWYVYAKEQDGLPVPSEDRVGQETPGRPVLFYRKARSGMTVEQVDLEAHPELVREFPREKEVSFFESGRDGEELTVSGRGGAGLYAARKKDRLCNLVIFVRFRGEAEFVSGKLGAPVAGNLDIAANYDGVRRYFDKISDGTFDMDTQFLTTGSREDVFCSYEDLYPRSYYRAQSASNPDGCPDSDEERTRREMALLSRALKAALPSLDPEALVDGNEDGFVDNVTFLVSGSADGWNDILWPHSWALLGESISVTDGSGQSKAIYPFNMIFADPYYAGVGVLSHELLHTAGFPDLYRYYDSTGGVPVGGWDVMATTDYADPQFPGAYLAKAYGGWGNLQYAEKSGIYTLYPLGADNGSPDGYLIPTDTPTEYLVAEYRREGDYGDVTQDNVPRDGLLLYRANTMTYGGNRNGTADGGDEVYIFRPKDTGPNAGKGAISQASLSGRWNYTSLGSAEASAPAGETLYLNDGSNTRVVVSEVRENSNGSISFRLTLPEDEEDVPPGTYDLSERSYTLTQPGEYRFTGVTGENSIRVAAGAENITVILDNVRADLSGTDYGCPLYIKRGAAVRVITEGENSLAGGRYEAAVRIVQGAEVTIEGPGTLEAFGGGGAAAIGGNQFEPSGSLKLSGAHITAYGGGSFHLESGSVYKEGEAAPALGGGSGQWAGDILAENSTLELYAGVNDAQTEYSLAKSALSTCSLSGRFVPGGSVTLRGCTLKADGALWTGEELLCEDSRISVTGESSRVGGCLEAYGSITLRRCETELRAETGDSALGGAFEDTAVAVEGGRLWAASAGYTLQGGSINFDQNVELFLSSGMTETLFTGWASQSQDTPLKIQPGMTTGALARPRLIQGTMEEALTADRRVRLCRNGTELCGLTLPAGCRTFALTVPEGGTYTLLTENGEVSDGIRAAGEGVNRLSPLTFSRISEEIPVLALSGGTTAISESGEYILTGDGANLTVGEGLTVVLRLRGANLTGPNGQAAISTGKGTTLTVITEELGGDSSLTGGRTKPAIEAGGELRFRGTGRLLALGGGTAPAVKAAAAAVQRECRLLLASCGKSPVELPAENRWASGSGEPPLLLQGVLSQALTSATELRFRGTGELDAWNVPKGLLSFCKTLPERGQVVLVTGLAAQSPSLFCTEENNVYGDIPLTRWDNATQNLDLSAGEVEITENGTYKITGSTDTHRITVADGVTATLRLDGVIMNFSQTQPEGKGLIQLGKGCSITLFSSEAEEASSLKAGRTAAVPLVYVPHSSRLTLSCPKALTVIPGGRAPAFGVPEGEDAGEILFSQGTVNCSLPSGYQSQALVGGKNSTVRVDGGALAVTGTGTGAVGGPGARVFVTDGSLSLCDTLGGENARVRITGGRVSLSIGEGDTGVGGRNAVVEIAGGSVWVSDIADRLGGMTAGIGGAHSTVRITGGWVQVDSARAVPGRGALGGESAFLSVWPEARLCVRMKQRRNNPLTGEEILDPAMTGGFLDLRLAKAFSKETPVELRPVGQGPAGEAAESLTLPQLYYGFFLYLPAGVFDVSGPDLSCAGAAEIFDGKITRLENVSFDRLAGVWFSDGTAEYDGTARSLPLSGTLPEGAAVSYQGNGQTLPGEYPVTATVAYGGTSYELTAVLTVTKAPLTVVGASIEDKEQYDGSCAVQGSLILEGAKGADAPEALADFGFTTPDVGRDKPVKAANLRLSPEWEDRYVLTVLPGALDHLTASVLNRAPAELRFREEDSVQRAGENVTCPVTVEPEEAGLIVTYNGEEALPGEPGVYQVEAFPADPNYTGSVSGTLRLTEALDLSAGNVEIRESGCYTVFGSTEEHRIVLRAEQLRGDVTLRLENVTAVLNAPGAAVLAVEGSLPENCTLTLLLPEGTCTSLRGGPSAPAIDCGEMGLRIVGSGSLRAYGGEGAQGIKVLAAPAVEGDPDCQLYSTLEQTASPWDGWTAFSFEALVSRPASFRFFAGETERELEVPQGYRSVLTLGAAGIARELRTSEGQLLVRIPSEETAAFDLPFEPVSRQEQLIDISRQDSLHITEDGVYRLTGKKDGFFVIVDEGVEPVLILDGVTVRQTEEGGAFLRCGESGRLVLVCESDSVLETEGPLLSGEVKTLRLEGPGVLTAVGSLRAGTVELTGSLDITGGGESRFVFDDCLVNLLPGGTLRVQAQREHSGCFGPGARFNAVGGRAELLVSGARAVGFEGTETALSGGAEVLLRVTGENSTGIDLTAGNFRISAEDGASLTGYSVGETALCLRGSALGGCTLLCALPEGGLTAGMGSRTVKISGTGGWTGQVALPKLAGGIYSSFLTLLPAGGEYEFTCPVDGGSAGVMLTASLRDVEAGLSCRELSFQALPRFTGLSLRGASCTYDRTEKRLEVTGAPAGAVIEYENNGHTEPGSYLVRATVRREGYSTASLQAGLVIRKVPLGVAVQVENKAVYDGSTAAEGIVLLSGALPGDAPEAQAEFAFDTPDVGLDKTVQVTGIRLVEDENRWEDHYVLEKTSATATASILAKADGELQWEESSLTQEYGSVTGAVWAAREGAPVRVLYDGEEAVPRLPGAYRVEASAEDRNWTGSISGEFTVLPKAIAIKGFEAPGLRQDSGETAFDFEESDAFDRDTSGILEGDEVLLSGRVLYPDLEPGVKEVALTGLILSGAQADRYRLVSDEAVGVGSVEAVSSPSPQPGPVEEDPLFADIEGHWAREEILAAARLGLLEGTGGGKFSPGLSMNRAMLMAVLCRLDGGEAPAEAGSLYSDVAPDSWYAPYVSWASVSGVGQGMGSGTFRPLNPITREQLAVFLYRFTQYRGLEAPAGEELLFPDAHKASPWAEEALRWAAGQGILRGRTSGALDPGGTASRAEVAVMLCRYLEIYFPEYRG